MSTPSHAAYDLLAGPVVILTGAGLSTDSGIPDYRGPGSVNRSPMTYQEFVSGPEAQQRYWARSFVGWHFMGRANPNPGHDAVAQIAPDLLITQNVDGLHERAGSAPVVALHGRLSEVVCLDCREVTTRASEQQRLEAANPAYDFSDTQALPDGDAAIDHTSQFVVPGCRYCGGRLKPHVVFFGENVPADRVARCYAALDELAAAGGSLLVAGSSLTVMSGLRFVKYAAGLGTPIVIVNRGETRGDPLATLTLHEGCTPFLTGLAQFRAQSRVT